MNAGKVTISLPKIDLIKLNEYEKQFKVSRSGILKSAIELWFEVVGNQKKETLYKKVYSNKKIIADDKKIVEKLLPIALEVWPKFQGG